MMDEGAYHAEQLAIQKDIEDALTKARELGLSSERIKLLEWATGVHLQEKSNAEH